MSKFRDDLRKAYDTKVIKTIEKTVRAIVFVLDSQLANRTPVDTGRARANWIPSLNSPSKAKVEPNQKIDVSSVLATYKVKDTVFISNNLPYIRRLNEGHSKQAPAGFVDDAIAVAKSSVK
jgi:hypothetical protein